MKTLSRRYRTFYPLALALAFVVSMLAQAAQAAPVAFYTDIDSGPNGAFVTVWGKGFGSNKGSVLVGSGTASGADILSWTDKMIEFRLPAGAGNGVSVRDSSNTTSNTLPFTTRSNGRIFYIATNGSDSNDGLAPTNQGGSGPWRTLPRSLTSVQPGDIVYVRGGNYTQQDTVGSNSAYGTVLLIRDKYTGTPGNPIALVGYPGETAVIGPADNSLGRAIYMYKNLTDWTIAKFTLNAGSTAIGMTQLGSSARIRMIANTAGNVNSTYGTLRFRACSDCKVLGNHVFNSGKPGNKLAHLIYYGGFGPASNVEIAWNLLHDERGGRCIQVYGHTDQDQLSGLSIHDNVIYNCPYDGILVGSSDAAKKGWISDALVYNNVVYNTGTSGIRIDNPTVKARVLHNTVYQNAAAGAESTLRIQLAGSAEIRNNIFAKVSATTKFLNLASAGSIAMSNNGYMGGSAPSQDTQPFTGNAAFTDAANGDFSLLPTSPFLNKGVQLTPALPEVSIPFSTFPDLGALTWVMPASAPQTLALPQKPAKPSITLQ